MIDEHDRNAPEKGSIKNIPTLREYERKYGKSCEGNDPKAVRTFKEFESKEKFNRLRAELIWVKNEFVDEKVLDEIIGRKRKARHLSYSKWGAWMLLLMSRSG